MSGFLVVERVKAGNRCVRRLPKDLPWDIPGREQLEQALQSAGLAIIAVDNTEQVPLSTASGFDDSDVKARLRAELETLLNEADKSEVVRLVGGGHSSA